LPEGCELTVGIQTENVHLCYDFITVTVAVNIHCIKIILNIKLKITNRHFTLYKIIVLQTQMSEDKFVKYLAEFPYVGLDTGRQDCTFLTEAHLNRCNVNSITTCPANLTIYNMQTLTCRSSTFLRLLLTPTGAEEV